MQRLLAAVDRVQKALRRRLGVQRQRRQRKRKVERLNETDEAEQLATGKSQTGGVADGEEAKTEPAQKQGRKSRQTDVYDDL